MLQIDHKFSPILHPHRKNLLIHGYMKHKSFEIPIELINISYKFYSLDIDIFHKCSENNVKLSKPFFIENYDYSFNVQLGNFLPIRLDIKLITDHICYGAAMKSTIEEEDMELSLSSSSSFNWDITEVCTDDDCANRDDSFMCWSHRENEMKLLFTMTVFQNGEIINTFDEEEYFNIVSAEFEYVKIVTDDQIKLKKKDELVFQLKIMKFLYRDENYEI